MSGGPGHTEDTELTWGTPSIPSEGPSHGNSASWAEKWLQEAVSLSSPLCLQILVLYMENYLPRLCDLNNASVSWHSRAFEAGWIGHSPGEPLHQY